MSKHRRRVAAAGFGLLLALLGGPPLLAGPAHAADTGCYVSADLVNSCRAWFGGTAYNYPQVSGNKLLQMQYYESRLGRSVDVAHTYHSATDTALNATDLFYANRDDTYLLTNWRVTETWADGGGADQAVNDRIDAMAASIKSLGAKRIFLVISHEPENHLSSDPNCPSLTYVGTSGTPDDYKAMWRNVRSRFDAAGVSNVVWVMDYMNYAPWNCVVQDVYPGDDLVDWIVFNGYQTGNNGVSFNARVDNLYSLLSANSNVQHDYLSKPWGIGEWGIRSSTQASAYTYYAQARAAVEAGTYPQLRMFLDFDQNSPSTGDGSLRIGYDAAGVADPAEQAAFNAFATSPALTGPATYVGGDRTPPTVTLDAPTDGTTVSGVTTVVGTASDDVALAGTTLLVDGHPAGTASGPSPRVDWDTSTAAEGPHTLVLRSADRAGNTTDSGTVTVTVHHVVPDTTPPGAPGSVTATLTGARAAQVSWAAASDDRGVTGYHVLRNGVAVADLDGATTTWADTGLGEAQGYSYTVTAMDAAGNTGPAGGPATVTTPDTTAPTAPTGLSARVSGTQVTLSWSAASDAGGVRSYTVNRNGVAVATVAALTYVDSSAPQGATATYTVSATDTAGNPGPASGSVAAAVPDKTAPSAPPGLTAVGGARKVTLTWGAATDNVGVRGYLVYRGTSRIASLAATATGYTDSGLSSKRSYTYRLYAYDAAGNVGAASSATAKTT